MFILWVLINSVQTVYRKIINFVYTKFIPRVLIDFVSTKFILSVLINSVHILTLKTLISLRNQHALYFYHSGEICVRMLLTCPFTAPVPRKSVYSWDINEALFQSSPLLIKTSNSIINKQTFLSQLQTEPQQLLNDNNKM